MFRTKWFAYTAFVLLVLVLPVLLLLPADFFDRGQSLCLSVLLLGKTCYGCGITRGIQHLLHLDFATAWSYNKMSFLVLPLLLYLWLKYLAIFWRRVKG